MKLNIFGLIITIEKSDKAIEEIANLIFLNKRLDAVRVMKKYFDIGIKEGKEVLDSVIYCEEFYPLKRVLKKQLSKYKRI